MTYQFAGFFATPRVAKPQQLPDRAVWRDVTEPFVGVGVLLPSFLGKSPSAPAVTELAKQLGVACAENWLFVTYDCWGGEVDFVYGLGSRGGVPFGPLSADESAQLTYTELMLQFGIPVETAMDFVPFRRGFWGET